MNATYTVVPEGGDDGREDNKSIVLLPTECSDAFPSTTIYYQDLRANYGEAILVAICCFLTLLMWILYCAQLRTRRYKFKDKPKRFKTLCLLGLYPMTSLMAIFALLVPRSTILVDLVASCYLSVCIYVFITLIFHYFGGKARMIEEMAPNKVTIRTPPCCCCCCCLPDLTVNKINVRKFEVLTMQIAIVVPFVLFIKAVLWTDDVSVLHGINPNQALFYIILATVVSTLFAMYGLVVMVKATEQILRKHRIRLKFIVLQLVLVFTNLQSAVVGIFYRFGLPPCRGIIGTKVRGSVIQHMLLVVEMFLLAILASRAYRRSEQRDLTETNLSDAGQPIAADQKYETVATSTDDLNVYLKEDPREDHIGTPPTSNCTPVVDRNPSIPKFTLD